MINGLPYIVIGCTFYMFGLKWCYEYAKFWVSLKPRDDQRSTKTIRFRERCEKFLRRHPIEGTLKLIATGVGLALTLASNVPERSLVSPKVVYATIYLFFSLSGLVDVLHFYFPDNISDGLVKMVLAQSFFIEGFLLAWTEVTLTGTTILSFIVSLTALAVTLELVWPEIKLLRAFTTLLHGQWIAHMVRTHYIDSMSHGVALAFSWHIAAASTVTLCIVAITRMYAPRLIIEQPPEIPFSDCYQRCDRIM